MRTGSQTYRHNWGVKTSIKRLQVSSFIDRLARWRSFIRPLRYAAASKSRTPSHYLLYQQTDSCSYKPDKLLLAESPQSGNGAVRCTSPYRFRDCKMGPYCAQSLWSSRSSSRQEDSGGARIFCRWGTIQIWDQGMVNKCLWILSIGLFDKHLHYNVLVYTIACNDLEGAEPAPVLLV